MTDDKNSVPSVIRHASSVIRIITASEIEFYLHGSEDFCRSQGDMSEFWQVVEAVCEAVDIPIFNTEKERGREQHEISLAPCPPAQTIADTNAVKEIITQVASKRDMQADFSAKPFADDFGSGLHIHIHLEDENGKNLFYKDDERMSDYLAYSIGGLLKFLPDNMPIFAPNEQSYARFVAGKNAPTTISWGANNRTTALRLPDSASNNKRIEHRVAGADADVEKVVGSIIAAIDYGIKHKIQPPEQIYGDASLDMYNLQKFPLIAK